MKVIQVNNFHRTLGGSDIVANSTIKLLKSNDIDVHCLIRDSNKLAVRLIGKLQAFTCGFYSASACREMERIIRKYSPDVVQVHEIFPFISPWILHVCGLRNIPVVMTCHNYRLTCPTAHHFTKDAPCELCSGGKEYWCIFKNCRGSAFESTAYALRNAVARKLRHFHKNVTLFLALSEFIKDKLIKAGVAEKRIAVLHNMVSTPGSAANPSQGKYFAFVGRISSEKGIDSLITAARISKKPVRLAGNFSAMTDLVKSAPKNVEFMGYIKRDQLEYFYRKARGLILTSKCFEVNPLVVNEAMSYGLPVIASRIGGIPEMVEDCRTGFLFEPGNSEELAIKMSALWNDPELCQKMGQAGRKKVIEKCGEEVYFKKLLAIYERAIEMKRKDGEG